MDYKAVGKIFSGLAQAGFQIDARNSLSDWLPLIGLEPCSVSMNLKTLPSVVLGVVSMNSIVLMHPSCPSYRPRSRLSEMP